MRLCACLAVVVALVVVEISEPHYAFAAPASIGLRTSSRTDHFQLVDDTCWWWGTRWQYGWRGYAWYPCWDWTKPQPTIMAPEDVPQDALTAPNCVRSRQAPSGDGHSRKVC
jgi:hypothetical protein